MVGSIPSAYRQELACTLSVDPQLGHLAHWQIRPQPRPSRAGTAEPASEASFAAPSFGDSRSEVPRHLTPDTGRP